MAAAVTSVLTRAFDLALYPVRPLPALFALLIVALATAAFFLLVTRATTDAKALRAIKRQMQADLFEIRLFRDDVGALWRAQYLLLRHHAGYLRLLISPIAVSVAAFVVIAPQLETYFAYAADVNEPVTITVQWRETSRTAHVAPTISLDTSSSVSNVTPLIWFPALEQSVGQVAAHEPGMHLLQLHVDGATYTKTLSVSPLLIRRSPSRRQGGFIAQFLTPSEPPLPAESPLRSITLAYRQRPFVVLWWRLNWLIVYVVLVTTAAAILKRPLRVEV